MNAIRARQTWLRFPATGQAALLLAILTFLQCVLVGVLIARHAGDARILDDSGFQRARSQRIAYLALAGYVGREPDGWRDELESTARGLSAVQARLMRSPTWRIGTLGADGMTPIGRRIFAYAAAAERLAARPHDVAAFAAIERERLPLLAELQSAVAVRERRIEARNRTLQWTVVATALAYAGLGIGIWLTIVLPGERAIRDQLARASALTRLAAAGGREPLAVVADALAETARLLGFDWGVLVEGGGAMPAIRLRTIGAPVETEARGLAPIVRAAHDAHGLADGAGGFGPWRAAVAVALERPTVAEAIVFGARRQKRPLAAPDRDFLGVVAALLATTLEQGSREHRLGRLAYTDTLTGLANRAAFDARLSAERPPYALLLLDLDRFKPINDRYGHAVGDAVLRLVGRRLADLARAGDLVARIGGDEFAVIEPLGGSSETAIAGARSLAMRIVTRLGEPFVVEGRELHIGTSVGIALAPDDAIEPSELVRLADTALYHGKRVGGGCVRRAGDQETATAS